MAILRNNISGDQEAISQDMGIMDYIDRVGSSKIFIAIQIIVAIYCLILLFNIVYCSIKISLFKRKVRQLVTGSQEKPETYKALELLPEKSKILEINKKITSDIPSDWKLAVIEGDKILDKILVAKGYAGLSLGDKLKQMVPGDLPDTYEDVWEAHKIRNRIVHEPEFEISQNDARRIVGIYERAIKKMS